jgi:hypothetical protein
VYHNSLDGGGWRQAWDPLDGFCRSQPVVVSWASDRLDVVVLGDDNILYWKSWNGSYWSDDWVSLGAEIKLKGPPALVSWGPGRLDLFALDLKNFLYHKAYSNGVWDSTWAHLGGIEASSPPVAVSWGANRLDVFITTRDNTVMHLGWNSSDWTPWNSLGQLEAATTFPEATGADATSISSGLRSSSTTSSESSVKMEKKGLTSGALAGVVVACLIAGALVLGGFFWYWFRHRRYSQAQPRADDPQPPASTDLHADPTATTKETRPLDSDERHELEVGGLPELEAQERRELDARV